MIGVYLFKYELSSLPGTLVPITNLNYWILTDCADALHLQHTGQMASVKPGAVASYLYSWHLLFPHVVTSPQRDFSYHILEK